MRGRRPAGRRRHRPACGLLGRGREGDGGARFPARHARGLPLGAPAFRGLDALPDRTDIGLALDTGELTVARIDPVDIIERYGDRIWHVQFQDALAVDTDEDYLQSHAHWTVRVRGGAREVPRWFAEPGADGGLVDFPAVTRALLDAGYDGWIVFESDQSPHPAASCLLAGYLLQRELLPVVDGRVAVSG